jgi:hypothetical protein
MVTLTAVTVPPLTRNGESTSAVESVEFDDPGVVEEPVLPPPQPASSTAAIPSDAYERKLRMNNLLDCVMMAWMFGYYA